MKLIKLHRKNIFTKIDDEDFEFLNRFIWSFYKKKEGNKPKYAQSYISGKTIFMHQLLLPCSSRNLTIDHKDGNGLNNQKNNLRLATNQQQQANRKKGSNFSSVYKGVSWRKDTSKWVAGIKINQKRIILGQFSNEIRAAKAYNEAALKYFGEFAKLNEFKLEDIGAV
jgi:hypothetical protein